MGEQVSESELQQAFKLIDTDNDGKITSVELRDLIARVGGSMSVGEATGLIHVADKDNNGYVDFKEFRRLWEDIRADGGGDDMIRSEFQKLDKDHSGFITKEEMLDIVNSCEHFDGDKVAEAKSCIAELDVDKDGKVSYPEFCLVWKYRDIENIEDN